MNLPDGKVVGGYLTVYVLCEAPHNAKWKVIGVYLTPEDAQAAVPGDWRSPIDVLPLWQCPDNLTSVRLSIFQSGKECGIFKFHLDAGDDPVAQFGAAVLAGDMVAVDAVRDILKI